MTRTYLEFIDEVAREDVTGLLKAQRSYGDSWKKRGGVGAFMMLARKWDRVEKQVCVGIDEDGEPIYQSIFVAIKKDTRAEGLIDDVRDLRRYLLLVEAEMRARGAASAKTTHRDNVARGVELAKETMALHDAEIEAARRGENLALKTLRALRDMVKRHCGSLAYQSGNVTIYHASCCEESLPACEALVAAGWMQPHPGYSEGRAGYVFTEASKQ